MCPEFASALLRISLRISETEKAMTRNKRTRANGEGSIYKLTLRGNVVWRASYRVPYIEDVDGVPTQRWKNICGTSPSKTEAIARRQALLDRWQGVPLRADAPLSAVRQQAQPSADITVAALLAEWLARKKSNPSSPAEEIGVNVARMYERSIALHIAPALGSLDITQVSRRDLSKFLTETLSAKTKPDGTPLLGSSPKRQIRNILSMAFAWAVDQEYLTANPALSLPTFSKVHRRNEQLERKKWVVQRLVSKIAGTPEEAYWVLAFHALRQSERLGLTFDCFTNLNGYDKKRPTRMEIKQQLWRNPNTGELTIKADTKTEAGTRIVPLDPRVASVLRAHQKRQMRLRQLPGWDPLPGMENLVFTHENGRPISHQRDNKRWHALFQKHINGRYKSGDDKYTEPLRGHALRHLGISMMVGEGQPIEVVRMLAGHSDEAITRAVYTHLSWIQGKDAISSLTSSIYKELDAKREKDAKRDREDSARSATASS